MDFLKQIYFALERTFFQTLTRKLCGNIGFLLLLQTGSILVAAWCDRRLRAATANAAVPPEAAAAIGEIAQQTLMAMVALYLSVVLVALATLWFLRHLIVRPVRDLTQAFSAADGNGTDLSIRVPARTCDELRDLSESINAFLARLRQAFLETRQMGLTIAVNSVQVARKVELASDRAEQQGQLAKEIFVSSQEATAAFHDIAGHTHQISASTSQNLEVARTSFGELESVNAGIHAMDQKILSTNRTIGELQAASQEIHGIVGLIRSISTQTSLLALNAAIEAARAGQAGRGFSIVAEEVKKLAEQVQVASEAISGKIQQMLGLIEESQTASREVGRHAGQTREAVVRSCHSFQQMIGALERNDAQLQGITAAVEQLSAANEAVHGRVGSIHEGSLEVVQQMQQAKGISTRLQTITETMQESVARFHLGQGALEQIIVRTRQFRDQCQERLESLARQQVDVFDRNYRPVPGTDPPKYRTGYDAQCETVLRPLYDQLLDSLGGARFALCVDANGFAPTHNSRYSQPLTGKREIDLQHSRDKRIFNDGTGLRAARNQNAFLLQTYMRDTGEILCDLSLPLLVGGRHWGAVRLGFDPRMVLDSSP